jgi:predicted ester cyclase
MSGTNQPDDRTTEYFGEDNFPAPYLTGGEPPSEYEKANIRVIERVLDEFWFKGEVAKGPEFFAPGCWRYDPLMPDVKGPEAYGEMVTKYHKAFQFQENDLQIVMADQDWIAWRAVTKCKHVGEFEGIPGTGAQCAVVSHTFVRFDEQHKAHEGWALTDYLSLVIQMFFALNWFQRLLYLPRFYKALSKIKNNMELPPTDPCGKRHLSTPCTR